MAVVKGETIEAELNRFIRTHHDRRVTEESERPAQEAWMESERKYEDKRRRDTRATWYDWHLDQAERQRHTLEGLITYHETQAARLRGEQAS